MYGLFILTSYSLANHILTILTVSSWADKNVLSWAQDHNMQCQQIPWYIDTEEVGHHWPCLRTFNHILRNKPDALAGPRPVSTYIASRADWLFMATISPLKSSPDCPDGSTDTVKDKNATIDIIKTVRDVEYKIPHISMFSLQFKQVVCNAWA